MATDKSMETEELEKETEKETEISETEVKETSEEVVESEETDEVESVEETDDTIEEDESVEETDDTIEEDEITEEEQNAKSYKPNFKYKAMDKELEVPEFLRSVIKDEETEKNVIDLLTRADGIEEKKAKLNRQAEEYKQQVQSERDRNEELVENFMPAIKADHLLKSGKPVEAILSLFNTDEVLAAAQYIDQLSKAEPSKRIEMRRSLEANINEFDREREARRTTVDTSRTASELLSSQIKIALLSDPEASAIAKAFDAENAKDGLTFEKLVYNEGDMLYKMSNGKMTPPQEVVKILTNRPYLRKYLVESQSTTQSTGSKPVSQQKVNSDGKTVVIKNKLTTGALPNSKSQGSAAGKKPKTLADIADMSTD